MGATGTRHAIAGKNRSAAALQPDVNLRQSDSSSGRHVFYGLPCANCHTYYDADQSFCPVCKSDQRVAPNTAPVPAKADADTRPRLDYIDEERERFHKVIRQEL